MGVIDTVLDKLMFWRDDPENDIEGCFTLPGAELDRPWSENDGKTGRDAPGGEDC